MEFDDSIFDSDKLFSHGDIDDKELVKKLRVTLEDFLKSKFKSTPNKQNVEHHNDRINFACPYCGDSKTNTRKKRGNFYTNSLWYICFNCGESKPFYSMLKDYNLENQISADELFYLKNNVDVASFTVGFGGAQQRTTILDIQGLDNKAINRSKLMDRCGFSDIKKGSRIYDYLDSRLQIPKNGDLRHFAYDSYREMLYIINLTRDKNKLLGIQGRRQNKKAAQKYGRFRTYTYTEIITKFFKKEIDETDKINRSFNKFSMLYNVMHVDFNRDVYVFESAMDSHFMKNAMAIMSANVNITFDNACFFFDNSASAEAGNLKSLDSTGKKAAIKTLSKGYKTFLWSKFIDDYPIYHLSKDLNEIMQKKPINQEILKNYFSNYHLDSIYI